MEVSVFHEMQVDSCSVILEGHITGLEQQDVEFHPRTVSGKFFAIYCIRLRSGLYLYGQLGTNDQLTTCHSVIFLISLFQYFCGQGQQGLVLWICYATKIK